MGQRWSCPLEKRRRVGFTWAWTIETATKIHIGSGFRLAFVFAKTSVSSESICMRLSLGYRPGVCCSPAFGLGYNVAEAWAFENAGVLSLEPLIEPCERLDVQTLPRPCEAVFSHHGNSQMFGVGNSFVGPESMGQVKWHVHPVAAHIH